MSYQQKRSDIEVRTRAQFSGAPLSIGNITDIQPIEIMANTTASTATFDYLSAVANHLYYIEKIFVTECSAITGNPRVNAYNESAVAQAICYPNSPKGDFFAEDFWCTRLEHLLGGASAGDYSIIVIGFDLTYT